MSGICTNAAGCENDQDAGRVNGWNAVSAASARTAIAAGSGSVSRRGFGGRPAGGGLLRAEIRISGVADRVPAVTIGKGWLPPRGSGSASSVGRVDPVAAFEVPSSRTVTPPVRALERDRESAGSARLGRGGKGWGGGNSPDKGEGALLAGCGEGTISAGSGSRGLGAALSDGGWAMRSADAAPNTAARRAPAGKAVGPGSARGSKASGPRTRAARGTSVSALLPGVARGRQASGPWAGAVRGSPVLRPWTGAARDRPVLGTLPGADSGVPVPICDATV